MKELEEKMSKQTQKLKSCRLCPRNCGVNRLEGECGVCGQTEQIKAARAGLHMWEEPCISGTKGSGTIFFSGCSLHCVYCQNAAIANGSAGKEISIERLAEIFLELQGQQANNVNLVTPGHFVPQIKKALDKAKRQGFLLPVVYNTGSYESVENIRSLEGYIDVYLPDLKYKDAALSAKYSHAPDYFFHAGQAIAEMVRQTGEPQFVPEPVVTDSIISGEERWKHVQWMTPEEMEDDEGTSILVRGTVVRHLLLPGCLSDAKGIIKYLLDTYGDKIYISLMSQYTPAQHLPDYPELGRRVTEREYEALLDYAIGLGINLGFIQDGEAAEESFIPAFDGYGI